MPYLSLFPCHSLAFHSAPQSRLASPFHVEIPVADLVFPGSILCRCLCVLIGLSGAVKFLCFNAVALLQSRDGKMVCRNEISIKRPLACWIFPLFIHSKLKYRMQYSMCGTEQCRFSPVALIILKVKMKNVNVDLQITLN